MYQRDRDVPGADKRKVPVRPRHFGMQSLPPFNRFTFYCTQTQALCLNALYEAREDEALEHCDVQFAQDNWIGAAQLEYGKYLVSFEFILLLPFVFCTS